ncbi:MAG: PEP-CTERM sorting domain-containing protein [Betaproteobacteria bacterium]
MNPFRQLATALLFACIAAPITAQALTVNASDRGWYRYNYGNGLIEADANNLNYLAGLGAVNSTTLGATRNYFAFNLTAYAGQTFNSATLHLYNPKPGDVNGSATVGGFYQYMPAANAPSYETYEVRQVTSDINSLLNASAGWTGFNDLGDGAIFGSYNATLADNGTFIDIILNADGLAALNAAVGEWFVVGGRLSTATLGIGTQTLFGFSNQNNLADTQLVLTQAVPEPGTFSIALLGLSLIGFTALRSRKQK